MVSQEAARAYAKWKGGKLPKETEWQLAAGGSQKLKWPWSDQYNADKCHSTGFDTMPVDALSSTISPYPLHIRGGAMILREKVANIMTIKNEKMGFAIKHEGVEGV